MLFGSSVWEIVDSESLWKSLQSLSIDNRGQMAINQKVAGSIPGLAKCCCVLGQGTSPLGKALHPICLWGNVHVNNHLWDACPKFFQIINTFVINDIQPSKTSTKTLHFLNMPFQLGHLNNRMITAAMFISHICSQMAHKCYHGFRCLFTENTQLG